MRALKLIGSKAQAIYIHLSFTNYIQKAFYFQCLAV